MIKYMSILSIFALAISLSMDNLAVAIAAGCGEGKQVRLGPIVQASVCFALAHVLMFSIGWMGGVSIERWVQAWSYWLVFLILIWVGGHMIKESFSELVPINKTCFTFKNIAWLSLATSIDALAIGVGLSFVQVPFFITIGILAFCVWITSGIGFLTGSFLGRKFGHAMEALGGGILIVMGIKILLSGLRIW